MKSTTHWTGILALTLIAASLQGCFCLQSISLKPQLSSLDLKAAKVGTVDFDVEFNFNSCCPTKEQKALALDTQKKIAAKFDDVLAGRITLAAYNDDADAAKHVISDVLLICRGQEPNPNPASSASPLKKPAGTESLLFTPRPRRTILSKLPVPKNEDQAWENVRTLNKSL